MNYPFKIKYLKLCVVFIHILQLDFQLRNFSKWTKVSMLVVYTLRLVYLQYPHWYFRQYQRHSAYNNRIWGEKRKEHDREKFSKIGTEIPLLPSKKTFSSLQLQNAKGPASYWRVNLEPERLHPEFHSVFIGFIKCKNLRICTSQSFEKTCNRRSIKKAHGSP